MYKLKDEYKGQSVTAFIAKEFEGKTQFFLEECNQKELEYLYKNGNKKFIDFVEEKKESKKSKK